MWAYVCLCTNLCTLLPCLGRWFPSKKWSCRWYFQLAAVWLLCTLPFSLVCCYKSHSVSEMQVPLEEMKMSVRWFSTLTQCFLRFDVTAFPTPTEVTFTFMGPSGNGTGSPQTEPDGIRLEGVCGPHKAVVFRSTCFVIVSNVTTQRAAGFYRVTVTNTRGSAHFRLQIRYKGRSELAGQI